MENALILVFSIFTVVIAMAAWWLRKSPSAGQTLESTAKLLLLQQDMQNQMQAAIGGLREEIARSLKDSSSGVRAEIQLLQQQVGDRLKESTSVIQSTQTNVGARLDSATKVIGDLQNKLGSLEESNRRILDVGQGLKDLKDILSNPKLRGNMGEYFLEDLLRQILPASAYSFQYGFPAGDVVDAVIRIGDSLVPVDSKFPLESFIRLLKIPDSERETKNRERRAFRQTIKKHADAIAKKYILPQANTYDFAFMYIPAENVYYETIISEDFLQEEGSLYAWLLEKRVIPVSPNTLYAYLQVILLGLKGLRIQESAKHILQGLDHLASDLSRFQEDFAVLGKHLKNAGSSFESAGKRLDKFQDRFELLSHNHLETTTVTPIPVVAIPQIEEPHA